MVDYEFGTVTRLSRDKSWGFLNVTDQNGQWSSESLFFHMSNAVYPEISAQGHVHLDAKTEQAFQRLRLPRPHDSVIFIRGHDLRRRPMAARWTYLTVWSELSN